ncbi:MAG: hypothetical protein JXQ30_01100 [Spirochaetes bacterium]|nr:hypothetical protein [Spirochaetota bacterium]
MRKEPIRMPLTVFLLSALILVMAACNILFPANYLSGTLTKSDVNGKTAYVKVVARGEGYTAAPLYFTTAVFSEGSASFSITYVKADVYTVWIFIDANDTAAGDETSLPDSGDYGTDGGRDIDMSSDQTVEVGESEWILFL